jgi:hypothetical protein
MLWTNNTKQARSSFAARSFVLLAVLPVSAFAADIVRSLGDDAEHIAFWVALIFVQLVTLIGYAGSSLPGWAKWIDGDTRFAILTNRLTILAGLFTSLFAGNVAYYAGFYYLNSPQIACFIAAGLCGFGGDRAVSPMLNRVLGKIAPQQPGA